MNSWDDLFSKIKQKDYYISLENFLDREYINYTIYPKREDLFRAFSLTPVSNLKVVIVGQDPYPNPNQAMGLSFSVPSSEKLPPSLRNIYKEIENEFGIKMKPNGDLTYLAKQGVLLLNTILTVRAHNPLSHDIKEYKQLMSDIFDFINKLDQPIVFVLWGGNAKKLKKYLNNPNHLILEANHPSPLSANRGGFFGCNHFIQINEYLNNNQIKKIDWKN